MPRTEVSVATAGFNGRLLLTGDIHTAGKQIGDVEAPVASSNLDLHVTRSADRERALAFDCTRPSSRELSPDSAAGICGSLQATVLQDVSAWIGTMEFVDRDGKVLINHRSAK